MNKYLPFTVFFLVVFFLFSGQADSKITLNEEFLDAVYFGQIDTVRLCLEKGAEINYKDEYGYTALMWAAQEGHIEIIDLLIQRGANTEPKVQGKDALWIARDKGHSKIVKILREPKITTSRPVENPAVTTQKAVEDTSSVSDTTAALPSAADSSAASGTQDPVFVPYEDPPVLIKKVDPKYPQSGLGGKVIMNVFVDETGKVKNAIVIKGLPDTGLDEAAIEAVKQWEYEPALQDGQPVAVWIAQTLRFEPEK